MAELRDQELATAKIADLEDAELLGFEQIETKQDPSTSSEDAIAVAFNKRGETVPPDARATRPPNG